MRRRKQTNYGAVAPVHGSNVPTTPPHPVPGGEYDRDGFLYKCPVENLRHEIIRTELAATLRPRMARLHGDRAVVASDVGLYARREDRSAKPLAPDILVSLTAGAIDAPGTPAAPDRMSYKLWQEPVPDLVIEIVSFGSGERDTVDKPNRYEAIGIPEYWIFDPERHRIARGLTGRLLVDGTYTVASPTTPAADQMPVPPGAIPYWSAVLGLYLYADEQGLAAPRPANRARSKPWRRSSRRGKPPRKVAVPPRKVAAQPRKVAAEEGRRAAEEAQRTAEEAHRAAEIRAGQEAARANALEAELETLRRRQ